MRTLHGISGLELAGLELGVEEGPGGAEKAKLETDELSFLRHVGQRDVLRIEAPAFGVGGVEGEEGAGERNTLLDHGVELEFVAGTGLMRDERPTGGVEGVVVYLGGLGAAGTGGRGEREDEDTALAGVVQERRRHHVRGRLLGTFGRGTEDG